MNGNKDVNWIDPLLGLRVGYHFNTHWLANVIADIGGTNPTTHYSYSSYSGTAMIGYQPSTPSWRFLTTYLGYRILVQ